MFYGKHKKDGSYGFFISKEDCENAFEISKEEWLSLIAAQKEGKEIIPNEDGSPFLREVIDTRTYAQKREVAYPSVNDYLDAYVKINSGDDILKEAGTKQLQEYIDKCLQVKATYPKP